MAQEDKTGETNLGESTSILNLRLGRVSNRKRLDSDSTAIETEVDRDALHISKELFEAPELQACYAYMSALKAQVRAYSAPAKHLRGGMYMVKTAAIPAMRGILEKAKGEFAPIVSEFANVVNLRRDEARVRLGPAFDAADYPNKEQVLGAFSIEWDWLTLATPSALKRISQEFFDQEKEKAESSFKHAVKNIEGLLLADIKKMVDRVVDRLTPDATGKKKIFRDSLVTNAKEFVSTFTFRNVSDSIALDAEVARLAKLLDGADPELLRSNDKIREDIALGFKQVQLSLDSMMEAAPERAFNLAELE